jgi:hypothetical protein
MPTSPTLTEQLAPLGVQLPAWPEEPEGDDPGNWIQRGQSYAEGMRLWRAQLLTAASIDGTGGKQLIRTLQNLGRQSAWDEIVIRYLLSDLQGASDFQRVQAAAKLVAANSRSAAQRLGAALEVAQAGFLVCAVVTIIQLVESPAVSARDCLDLYALLVAQLPATAPRVPYHLTDEMAPWLQNVAVHLQATSTLTTAVNVACGEQDRAALVNHLKSLLVLVASSNHAPDSDEHAAMEHVRAREERLLAHAQGKPLLRTLHHLACTGGTVISKCLAAMPDVALISEVNPFNRFGSEFEPTNPLLMLERGYRPLSDNDIIEDFARQIDRAHQICQRDDVDLIIRDHSHTDFCMGAGSSTACPIVDCLGIHYDLLSAVTVRHPLDSYLGLIAQGWHTQFTPSTLEQYCKRYLAFLDRYASLPILRYEDFCEDPEAFMRHLCRILEIGYSVEFMKHFGSVSLSGDSGRKGVETIELRPRRPVPETVQAELEGSPLYSELVSRLGY